MMIAKKVALCAVSVALLIALQYTFSFVPGVELVTVFMLCFCYAFGISAGMIAATCFSLLRCLLFGFYPNVLVLYLIYYNLFAILFGMLGKKSWGRKGAAIAELLTVTALAVFCTACFTLLDDIISPLFFGYTAEAAYAYLKASIYVMIPQCICALITVALLFVPLSKVFKSAAVYKFYREKKL